MTKTELERLTDVSDSMKRIGNAITPAASADGRDATGTSVGSLTEAVMGMTAGLVQIANALDNVADAIRESRSGE